VRPGYQKYISPLQIHADVVFQNTGSNYDEQPKTIDMIVGYVNMKFRFDKKV
jgi:uridine kinase